MFTSILRPAIAGLILLIAGGFNGYSKVVDLDTVKCHACDRYRETKEIKYAIARNTGEKVAICGSCQNTPQCYICEAPSGPGGHRLDDGRVFCRSDFANGIFELREAQRVLYETHRELARLYRMGGPKFPETNVTISVVSRDGLPKMMPGVTVYNNPRTGTLRSVTVTEMFDPTGRKLSLLEPIRIPHDKITYQHQIYVMSGLSNRRMMAAFAHELGRAWLNEKVPPSLLTQITPDTKATFSELIAYQLMGQLSEVYEKTYINDNLQPVSKQDLQTTDVPATFAGLFAWLEQLAVQSAEQNRPQKSKPVVPSPVAEGSPSTQLPPPLASKPTAPTEVTLKGLSGTTARRIAMINNVSLVEGEGARIRLAETNVNVKLIKIHDTSVTVQIDGKETELFMSSTQR